VRACVDRLQELGGVGRRLRYQICFETQRLKRYLDAVMGTERSLQVWKKLLLHAIPQSELSKFHDIWNRYFRHITASEEQWQFWYQRVNAPKSSSEHLESEARVLELLNSEHEIITTVFADQTERMAVWSEILNQSITLNSALERLGNRLTLKTSGTEWQFKLSRHRLGYSAIVDLDQQANATTVSCCHSCF
jgi:hypothetical protein